MSTSVAIFNYANEKLRCLKTAGPPSSVQELLIKSIYAKFCAPTICTFGAREQRMSKNVSYVKIRFAIFSYGNEEFRGLETARPPSFTQMLFFMSMFVKFGTQVMYTFCARA